MASSCPPPPPLGLAYPNQHGLGHAQPALIPAPGISPTTVSAPHAGLGGVLVLNVGGPVLHIGGGRGGRNTLNYGAPPGVDMAVTIAHHAVALHYYNQPAGAPLPYAASTYHVLYSNLVPTELVAAGLEASHRFECQGAQVINPALSHLQRAAHLAALLNMGPPLMQAQAALLARLPHDAIFV
ncbi:hypothetical protein H9P43_001244 [Blastocladiella emersonii ATCC 22665]|nr:hypothetical protein H9P43_001244 [Blastocladiella emersonii ATCC 22665]